MFYLKKLASALVLPPFGPILLALFGLWLTRRHPRLGRSIALVALLLLTALSLPLVANSLRHRLEYLPPIPPQSLARAQAIVILGGGVYDNAPEYGVSTIGGPSLERGRYGVYLQKRSGLPILITGGAPYGGRPEGEAMQETIEKEFGGRVKWTENASNDTAESAVLSAEILKVAGVKRIALVSHVWHLPRAVPLFERQGLEVFPAPTGYATSSSPIYAELLPSAGALQSSTWVLHEWLGIFVQRLRM